MLTLTYEPLDEADWSVFLTRNRPKYYGERKTKLILVRGFTNKQAHAFIRLHRLAFKGYNLDME